MRAARTLLRITGLPLALLLMGAIGRSSLAATDAAPTVPVRLVVCVENLDYAQHPIRIAIDGRPVFRRTVRGPTNANWPFLGGRCRKQTVRLERGEHQVVLEEAITHIRQEMRITVSRPCEVRIGFWPWHQDGRFRQEPHFTVTLHPPASQGMS